jgi:hypothetical protein
MHYPHSPLHKDAQKMTENAVIVQSEFNLTSIANIELPENFDAALAALKVIGGDIELASVALADEWPLVEKESLVNVPFLAMQWSVSNPENSEHGQFMSVRGMTKTGERFRISDGGTGIMTQLVQLTQKRITDGHAAPNTGLLCGKGLRVSQYTATDAAGKVIKAETYYINNQD